MPEGPFFAYYGAFKDMAEVGFKHVPAMKPLPDGEFWELLEDGTYETGFGLLTIRCGFKFNFASIPRWARWFASPATGKHRMAALLHDYLYSYHYVSQFRADGMFRAQMKIDGVPFHVYYIMWLAVRIGGGKPYSEGSEDAGSLQTDI